MNCPTCNANIPDHLVTQHAARLSGRKSRRTLTPEQARAMQEASAEARRKKREKNMQ